MSTLPELDFVVSCGHCGFDVEMDPETYTCRRCGLYWYVSNGECHYIDETLAPCGATPADPGAGATADGVMYWHAPCPLPAGHETEEHWHPLEVAGLEEDEDGE